MQAPPTKAGRVNKRLLSLTGPPPSLPPFPPKPFAQVGMAHRHLARWSRWAEDCVLSVRSHIRASASRSKALTAMQAVTAALTTELDCVRLLGRLLIRDRDTEVNARATLASKIIAAADAKPGTGGGGGSGGEEWCLLEGKEATALQPLLTQLCMDR